MLQRNRIKGQVIPQFPFIFKILLWYAYHDMVILFEYKNSLLGFSVHFSVQWWLFVCFLVFGFFARTDSLTLFILDFHVFSFCILDTFAKACFHSYIHTQDYSTYWMRNHQRFLKLSARLILSKVFKNGSYLPSHILHSRTWRIPEKFRKNIQ